MQLLLGLLLTIISGTLAGSVMTPIKFMRKFQFEHYWPLYSLFGTVLIPWTLAYATVPNLLEVYCHLPGDVLVLPPLFAFSWGIASMLAGLCVRKIGLSLTYALVIGVGASAGLLVPLLYFSPRTLHTAAGYVILFGVAVMISGLALVTYAGQLRDKTARDGSAEGNTASSTAPPRANYLVWVLIAMTAGLLAAGLNFGFAFGQDISRAAHAAGASEGNATYAVWSLAMLGGMVPNLAYPIILCARNKSWQVFRIAPPSEIVLSILMGFLFIGSTVIYGVGAIRLGLLGASVGWGIMQIVQIVVGNLSGFITREWTAARSKSVRFMLIGLAVLVTASGLIAFGNYLYSCSSDLTR